MSFINERIRLNTVANIQLNIPKSATPSNEQTKREAPEMFRLVTVASCERVHPLYPILDRLNCPSFSALNVTFPWFETVKVICTSAAQKVVFGSLGVKPS